MDVDQNGITYIAGFNRVVSVTLDGSIEIIVDNLNYEPVWVEVAIDGSIYINDVTSGLQKYNPKDKMIKEFKPNGFSPFGDILSINYNEFIFHETAVYFKYNLKTFSVTPLIVIPGNSHAFAANANNVAFFTTPGKPPFLDAHIISLTADGVIENLFNLKYGQINVADVDKKNRLCFSTNEWFKRVEVDNTVTTVNPIFELEKKPKSIDGLAISPDDEWHVICSNFDNLIQVYRFNDSGNVEFLPVVFTKSIFGGAYKVTDANIDIGDDGRIVVIVTATGTLGHGPSYQRVYTMDSEGRNPEEVANLDSSRIGVMVDIAIAKNNDIFVLSAQDNSDSIHRIDNQSYLTTEIIKCDTGHDPTSIDVDSAGNIWITTTKGIFRAEPNLMVP